MNIKALGFSHAMQEDIIGEALLSYIGEIHFPCYLPVVEGRFGKDGDPIVKLPNGKTLSAKYLNYAS